MKLAEALQERSDLNKKISDLRGRLNQNSLVQEGEIPNENPTVLMQELEAAITRLQQLIKDINLTNCATIIEGRSLTQIIAEKEGAIMRLSAYRALADSASAINYRARGSEIKIGWIQSHDCLIRKKMTLHVRGIEDMYRVGPYCV